MNEQIKRDIEEGFRQFWEYHGIKQVPIFDRNKRMNGQIIKLLKEAGGHMNVGEFRGQFLPPPPDYIDPETVDLKKFTRLLIEECADLVLGFQNQFGDSAHDEIKRHFGVK